MAAPHDELVKLYYKCKGEQKDLYDLIGLAANSDFGKLRTVLSKKQSAWRKMGGRYARVEIVELALELLKTSADRDRYDQVVQQMERQGAWRSGDSADTQADADAETVWRNEKQYRDLVFGQLWDWAERHCAGNLDGGRREGRPPVLWRKFAGRNVLVPPDRARADAIREAIGPKQRHRWFHSLRSSQALKQSVFGAARVLGRLDVLEVTAECGRPAFFADSGGWRLEMEHAVGTLNERRPTIVDVLLDGPGRRVAVECKFMEAEFGKCSRPALKPGDFSYDRQRCDGSYRVQAGRRERCALTEIGIRYWRYLPRVFNWAADRDHVPCPFHAGYQLARSALAACFTPDGGFDPDRGHALLIYDKRNPAFADGGEAERQWRDTLDACRVPGLLRRVSWQRLAAAIAVAPELAWLAEGLRAKYGIEPAPR